MVNVFYISEKKESRSGKYKMWTIIIKTHEDNIKERRTRLEYDRKWIEGIRKKELQTFPSYILVEGDKSDAINLFEQYFGFEPRPDSYDIADFSEGTTWHIRERESNEETLAHATGDIRGCSSEYYDSEYVLGTTIFHGSMDSLNEFIKRKDVLILISKDIEG